MTLHIKLFDTLETIQDVFYLMFEPYMEFSLTTTKAGIYWLQIEDNREIDHGGPYFAAEITKDGDILQMVYNENKHRQLAVLCAEFLSTILDKDVLLMRSEY